MGMYILISAYLNVFETYLEYRTILPGFNRDSKNSMGIVEFSFSLENVMYSSNMSGFDDL